MKTEPGASPEMVTHVLLDANLTPVFHLNVKAQNQIKAPLRCNTLSLLSFACLLIIITLLTVSMVQHQRLSPS